MNEALLDGTNGFVVNGPATYSNLGQVVAGGGDVNGDGADDLVMTAPAAGFSYVLLGRAVFPALVDLAQIDCHGGIVIWPQALAASIAGDLDGDGTADVLLGSPNAAEGNAYVLFGDGGAASFVAGEGCDTSNGNRVRVFDPSGTATAVDFLAYAVGHWGTHVAAGLLRGWNRQEILTGPGPAWSLGPQIRGFDGLGSPITKINFFAYSTLRFGADVGAGDVDGDVLDEILTGAGPGAVFGPHVRGWNYDGSALSALPGLSFFAYGTLQFGVAVGAGDVDLDSCAEVLTGPGPGRTFAAHARGWNYDGTALASIAKINFVAVPYGYGLHVAGGDVDADGFAEVVAAPGPGPSNPPRLRGFDYDGGAVSGLPGFDTMLPSGATRGATVSCGDVDGAGGDEIAGGLGGDPLADAVVRPYGYDGVALTPLAPFNPFPADAFGVNPALGRIGF
ncbi:MAG: integrin alpha [Acidobacteriota bacterium]